MEEKNEYAYLAYIFGDAIYKARKANRLSQQELAERLGIDVKHVGNLENGWNLPRLSTAIKIREHLGISIDEAIDEILKEKESRKDTD
ncbi:helix-turn-helix domain-containing protein [Oceanobacillus bengalensis]|uniref:helix-turn-helix domain-containing protein n=1 Tax=Oceanobacillus bengalensis TaxID=1435466 RepID=UPI001602C324|nr:helix-turn-helix transcriptional regulator [Oceanobacillus bengalensis]